MNANDSGAQKFYASARENILFDRTAADRLWPNFWTFFAMFQIEKIDVTEEYKGLDLIKPFEDAYNLHILSVTRLISNMIPATHTTELNFADQFTKRTYKCIMENRRPHDEDVTSIVNAVIGSDNAVTHAQRTVVAVWVRNGLIQLMKELNEDSKRQIILSYYFRKRVKMYVEKIKQERKMASEIRK